MDGEFLEAIWLASVNVFLHYYIYVLDLTSDIKCK